MPKLTKFYEDNKEKKDHFEIVAIEFMSKDIDSLKASLKTLETKVWKGNSLPFPVLLDDGKKTTKAYKASGFPMCFLIDPEGKIVKADHFNVEVALKEELDKIKSKK